MLSPNTILEYIVLSMAYTHLKAKRACDYAEAPGKIAKIVMMHSAVQTAAVTTISYKPLSDLKFAN